MHLACTRYLTCMHTGDRSADAIDAGRVLPGYQGVIVRDGYAGHEHLTSALHAWCGVHLLRDLKGLYDFEPSRQQRASQMAALLIEARDAAGAARLAGQSVLDAAVLDDLVTRYRALAAAGVAASLYRRTATAKDGRLARRFRTFEDLILRFATRSDLDIFSKPCPSEHASPQTREHAALPSPETCPRPTLEPRAPRRVYRLDVLRLWAGVAGLQPSRSRTGSTHQTTATYPARPGHSARQGRSPWLRRRDPPPDVCTDRQRHINDPYAPVRRRMRLRFTPIGLGRGPRARSAISAQKSMSWPRRISCQGARRRPSDLRVSSICCRRQNASLISILDCVPLGGYGHSSNGHPSTQLVPGADDVAVPTVSPGSRDGRYRVMHGGRSCRFERFSRRSLSGGWSPRSARFSSSSTSATSCWARPFSAVHPADGGIHSRCLR